MAKGKTTAFFCQNCGYESAKWMGQCPACKEWNTFVEEPVVKTTGTKTSAAAGSTRRMQLQEPSRLAGIKPQENLRISTGMEELDRVLGGGIVTGSLVLVGGDPGIGKSTLLLQVCKTLANKGRKVLYVSGEESAQQIKIRADRVGEAGDDLLILCETNLGDIREILERSKPEIVVIDSIQTMYSESVNSAPGSDERKKGAEAAPDPCIHLASSGSAGSGGSDGGYGGLVFHCRQNKSQYHGNECHRRPGSSDRP